jgi:hypothetical protein
MRNLFHTEDVYNKGKHAHSESKQETHYVKNNQFQVQHIEMF